MKEQAEDFDKRGIAKVFFYVEECKDDTKTKIIGFFALSLKSISKEKSKFSKTRIKKLLGGYPSKEDTILSFILIGQLAVDQNFQGKKFGTDMLRQIGVLSEQASKIFGGIKAILVDARNDEKVKKFYEKNGFSLGKLESTDKMETISMMAFIETLANLR